MPNLKINNKTHTGVSEVHIPLADGSGNEDFAYINSEAKSITENGTHDVKHYGTVNVNVPSEGIIPTGTKTITENGTYDVTEYASAKVEVPSEEPNIQSLNVTANGTYTAPSGVDGYSPITVNVPTESDIELQQKTVTPSETAQTITPDSGYDGLSIVSVEAISKTYVGSGVTKKSAQTYTPGTSNQTIASGQYLNGTQTIAGDADLVAGNIKIGVSIFGVAGTFEGGGLPSGVSAIATGTVTPSEDENDYVEITHNLGVIPNFVVWYAIGDYSSNVSTSYANRAILGATIYKQTKYGPSSSTVYNVHYWASGYNATPQVGYMSSRVSNNSYMTNTTCWLKCNATYMIKKGITYRWVCGVTV